MPQPELTASQENYLEAILAVCGDEGHAHVKEIAEQMGVRMASVTGALQRLSGLDLVDYRPYGVVTLTPEGRRIAGKVTGRHRLLRRFLHLVLGLEPGAAEENACRMEHAMDEEAIERLADYVKFIERCPLNGCTWHAGEAGFCSRVADDDELCKERLVRALEGLGGTAD